MKSLNDSLEEYKKIKHCHKSLQSYERYLQRLKTFEVYKWFAKPNEFSPIECAKRGWINLTTDTLKCVSCSNILYISSPSVSSLAKHFKNDKGTTKSNCADPKRLVDEHNHNCPWRALTVPDKFIQIDIYDEELIFRSFLDSVKSYKSCYKLPVLSQSVVEMFDLVYDLKNFVRRSDRSLLDGGLKNKTAIILSSCGWNFIENKDMLKCDRCLRSIGLWLYKSETSTQAVTTNTGDEEEKENPMNLDEMMIFANTQPYSDEIVVRNVLVRMINQIEIEQENAAFARLSTKPSASTTTTTTLKRKLSDADLNLNQRRSCGEATTKGSKELDPVREHFNWCPWLTQHETTLQVERNSCLVCYEVICKKLQTYARRKQSDQSPIRPINSNNNNADQLIDRIRSVQSLLINCASKYNLKST